MFLRKKKKEEADIRELLMTIEKQISNVSQAQEEREQITRMQQEVNDFGKVLKRHDMSLEDLLEEWSERKSDEEETKEQIRSLKETEERFLKLFEEYQEGLWAMAHVSSVAGSEWQSQIELLSRNIGNTLRICGIVLIEEETGKKVDYTVHEVVEAVKTTDPQKDKTVAEVYRPGYIYQGKVKKKAKIAAFRYAEL